jgi:hypothetical protein
MKPEHVLLAVAGVGLIVYLSSRCTGCGKVKNYYLEPGTGTLVLASQTSPTPLGFHYVATNGWLFVSDEGLY